MNKLEQELYKVAKLPNMTAVRFSKENEAALVKNYGITRQKLRDAAVLVDQHTKIGFEPPVEVEIPKKVKTVKTKIKKEDKADAKPPKVKAKPKAKTKAKTKLKKKS